MDRVLKYIYVMEASLGKSGKGRFSSHYLNVNPCHLPFYLGILCFIHDLGLLLERQIGDRRL